MTTEQTHSTTTRRRRKLGYRLGVQWGVLISWSITTIAVAVAAAAYTSRHTQITEVRTIPAAIPVALAEPATQATNLPARPLAFADGNESVADVAARTMPAVVNIFTVVSNGYAQSQSLGSGVIVRQDGLVVTNHHVVANARGIRVHLSDGRQYEANVVGTDQLSDMALLRLLPENNERVEVPAATFGDSSALRPGDVVLAIGNPFGVGQTVTMGIVSATGRANMGITEYEDFIQTDAAINPGNSGGALISGNGTLVGINTAIVSRSGGSQGIGFAIPSNMVRPIVDSLLANGKVVRGWLGVAIQDVNQQVARELNLTVRQGVLVTSVEEGSPAAQAGIQSGDVVTMLDGERLDSSAQLRNLVATRGAERDITLERIRGSEHSNVRVHLTDRPQGPAATLADRFGNVYIDPRQMDPRQMDPRQDPRFAPQAPMPPTQRPQAPPQQAQRYGWFGW